SHPIPPAWRSLAGAGAGAGSAGSAAAARLSFAAGHFQNYACAALWFTSLLLFLHSALGFRHRARCGLLWPGSWRTGSAPPCWATRPTRSLGCGCYGGGSPGTSPVGHHVRPWSFPFIFNPCLACKENTPQWAAFIYYLPFIIIFQFGWQPHRSPTSPSSPSACSGEYAFTVMANITVYGLAWLLLNFQVDQPELIEHLGPQDVPIFRNLSLIVVGLGAVFSLIFHLGTKEKPYPWGSSAQPEESTPLLQKEPSPLRPLLIWRDWLWEPAFYQVAVLYMSTRLIVNLSQAYIAMYLTNSLMLPKKYIATIPLVMYVSGFLSSFLMKPVNKWLGRNLTYFVGILVILSFASWVTLVKQMGAEIYGAAVLLGAGSATILVTSLSMTADLIGTNTHSSAFVYGAMSFTDKMANGLAVMAIQNLHPCPSEVCCSECASFYHWVMVGVTGGVAVAAIASLCCIMVWPIHVRYREWGWGLQECRVLCQPGMKCPSQWAAVGA
uniref:Uncharacterized protein n=1 Tax=Melopsittacus undulatus TaxID=13146 RepID=A0A8V5GSN2_MELUD